MNKTIIVILIIIALLGIVYQIGYDKGYDKGHDIGYSEAVESMAPLPEHKPDTVQTVATVQTTTTTTVRPKKQPEEPSVQIKTEAPKVVASVNGKKYEFKPQSEVLQTGVQTTAAISVKVPERRWKIGVGIDNDRKPAYMLSAPIKGAVGVWVAGSGRHKVMGGVSVSF